MLTDIATGWTECAPLIVREQMLLSTVLTELRIMNETLKAYCEAANIVFTRCRPLSMVKSINTKIGGNAFTNATIGNGADLTYVLIEARQPIILDHEINASVNLTFANGTTFQGNPVVETLTEISSLATETMN
ncbi:hypothetical protein XI09_02850 [Bradyrhizobium sp. CCBAU 11386]|nr:hypothetical protein [Bradyrhizobium sp. CCBAU 11361]MDA9503780.1 hypothetical protein [Bradyrhizobium sp. CCBAU 11386]